MLKISNKNQKSKHSHVTPIIIKTVYREREEKTENQRCVVLLFHITSVESVPLSNILRYYNMIFVKKTFSLWQ